MQKKYGLDNAEKTMKPKGAALRAAPLGIIIFCIGQGMFFCIWPILIFWALAHAYFLGFGPCLFFPLLFLAVARAGPRYF